MRTTIIETDNLLKRSATIIAVRPFVDPSIKNMGLENYNLALFDGIVHEEQLACVEPQPGMRRYITGLNEFAPEIKRMTNIEEKEAKIKQIRKQVSELEEILTSNSIDPADPQFWSKVERLRPNNDDFWGNIVIRCGNEPLYLDVNDTIDVIKLIAIEAGGFSMIAKSYEDARKRATPPKFYLDRSEDTATSKTEVKKLRNKAGGELQKLYDRNANKLFYVCKVVDSNSAQYRKTTPLDVMYENMSNYIDGLSVEKDKKKTAQRFIDIAAQDMETLKVRAIVKDSIFYKFIATKGDGFIYHIASNTMMGKNPSEVAEFLKNVLNEEILKDLMSNCEKYWNG